MLNKEPSNVYKIVLHTQVISMVKIQTDYVQIAVPHFLNKIIFTYVSNNATYLYLNLGIIQIKFVLLVLIALQILFLIWIREIV